MTGARGERPGEFELIGRYFRPLATGPAALGLGDDAAMLRPRPGQDLVVTTDLVTEGVHFFSDDLPECIARKALRVNLSDLAGKGATPLGYLLAIALPRDWTEAWVAAFAGGLAEDQKTYGISLIGGDTSRAAGGVTVCITAIGTLPKGTMVHRKGARPGDYIYVSGTIGDAALGLRLRHGTIDGAPAGRGVEKLRDRYLHPQPRVSLAPSVRKYASAALDVSDGLVGDLAHICDESRVSAVVEAATIPLSRAASALVATDPSALTTAITGGDDYEILAAIPPSKAAAYEKAAAKAGVPVSRIGRIQRGKGRPMVLGRDGAPMPTGPGSFDHFAG
jgi:thiamine-monophosphate kinase